MFRSKILMPSKTVGPGIHASQDGLLQRSIAHEIRCWVTYGLEGELPNPLLKGNVLTIKRNSTLVKEILLKLTGTTLD